jgi:hypothetical protein
MYLFCFLFDFSDLDFTTIYDVILGFFISLFYFVSSLHQAFYVLFSVAFLIYIISSYTS